MASKITNLKKWTNNERLNARDYTYERDRVVNKINTIIDEQDEQDDLLEGLREDVDDNADDIAESQTDITDLQNEKVDRAGDTITGNLTVEGATTLGSFTASSGSIGSLNVSGVNISQTVSDVVGLKNGSVRAKKAENTDDGAGNANTAQQIKEAVGRLNQDVKDTSTPTFVGVTLGDKTLTETKLNNLDTSFAHTSLTNNPHGVTKDQVSLGSVDNTSDADKPISTLTQQALNAKVDLVDGKVDPDQLPSYVDDIVEFDTLAELQSASKVVSKIYVVTDDSTAANNTSYRYTDGGQLVKFDHTSAEWGHITGTVGNQSDIENATFTPNSSGITATTVKTAIQEVKGYAKNIKEGTTNIDFLDADLSSTNVASAISEVQDNVDTLDETVDEIIAGTQNITYENTTVAGELGSLDGRLNTAEGDITSLENRMDTAEGDIDDLETLTTNITNGTQDITYSDTTVSAELTSLDSRLTTAETDIDNIEDGTTDIVFDPASSGLDSTTVEAAIKEIYAEKGENNGIATLDSTGRLPAEQLTLEAVGFKGTFGSASSTTEGDLPSSEVTTGDLYICDTNDYNSSVSGITFNNGDKALFDGSAWRKNDAFDAVTSVNGEVGAVDLDAADIDTDTSSFNGFLDTNNTTVQSALDVFDDHTHEYEDITNKPTTITGYGITDAYTKTNLDDGQLDNRYYTETELDNGQLDNRYYSESEVDGFLANKLDVGVLSSSIILYPTSTAADVSGYFKLVTSPDDPDFDDTAQDIETVTIDGQDVLLSELISEPNLFVGNPGIINVPVVGQIRKTNANPDVTARFYFEIYKRDNQGNEELLGTSDPTQKVGSIIYEEFNANALLNNGVFTATDRVVFKFYGNKVGSDNGTYEFKFGGGEPVRALLNVPITTTLQANRVQYANTDSTLESDDVKLAIDELDTKIIDSLTTIRNEQFIIVNPDVGDGTFTYEDANGTTQTGNYDGTWYTFDLQVAGFYANNNLVETTINDTIKYHTSDTDQLQEVTPDSESIVTSVKVSHNFVANDEIDITYYQGVSIVAQTIGDGTVTYGKLSSELQSRADDVENATSSNTAETLIKRNALGEFAGTLDGKFKTARTIALDGDVSGQATFDGSTGITITTVVADNSHVHTNLAGEGLTYNTGTSKYDVDKASVSEAEAGINDTVFMTPAKTKTAIETLAPEPTIASEAEAISGTSNEVFMTPLRTAQATIDGGDF